MSCLKKIGKTVSDKSKEVAQKVKTISETSSLNNIIKAEQQKIDTNYKMMGKLYFEKYCDNASEEFAESINAIKTSMKKIDETQEQITKIRNRNCCPNCGTSFKQDAVFCSKCGTKVRQEEPESQAIKCPNCGNELENEALFCDNCGTKISADESQPVSLKKTETVNEISENTAGECTTTENDVPEKHSVNIIKENCVKKCSKCGAESEDESALFCNECGTKF